jgi:hypothetical protein
MFFFNIIKAFILFARLIIFIYFNKIFFLIRNYKVYVLIFLYSYMIKLRNVYAFFAKLNLQSIKKFALLPTLKSHFLNSLKKYVANNFWLYKIFKRFKKSWALSTRFFLEPSLKVKIFTIFLKKDLLLSSSFYKYLFFKKKIYSILNSKFSEAINVFINFKIEQSFLSSKPIFKFFIRKPFNKTRKKVNFKNLFSLFFFNLLVYFFLIYFFIFWLNNLLNNIFYKSSSFLLKILSSVNIWFYKANFTFNRFFKKRKRKSIFFFKGFKLNKYYLMYNKLNLLKFNNILLN